MNKTRFLTLLCCGVLWACNEPATAPVEQQPENLTPGSSAISAEQQALLDCLAEPEQICQMGLWFAMLQDPINDLPLEDLGPKEIADSVISEQGYAVVRRTIYLEEGSIMVEGEYIPEDQATEELLNATKVNRIYVRSRQYFTQDSLRVGDTMKKLLETYGLDQLEAGSIPDYETIVIPRPNDGHIVYHFRDPDNLIGSTSEGHIEVGSLPGSWQIREIVIL